MRDFFAIDDSRFPIVVGKYFPFIPTQEEFAKSQTVIENFCASHSDFVLLFDFSQVPVLSHEYRIMQAKWVTQNDQLFVRQRIRFVFYTPVIMTRIMMKAFFIITRPSIPFEMVSTLEKAYAWAGKQLKMKPRAANSLSDSSNR